jgi:hypothetical protein
MAQNTTSTETKCARCGRLGHFAKDCSVPFFCAASISERKAEAAKRRLEWEARQEEKAKKAAEWAAKKAEKDAKSVERAVRKAALEKCLSAKKDCDSESSSNWTENSTVATAASIIVDEAEVECMALMDNTVRKFAKKLSEIEKLEASCNLDRLQREKIARKAEMQIEFETAIGLARVRAREQLKRQA